MKKTKKNKAKISHEIYYKAQKKLAEQFKVQAKAKNQGIIMGKRIKIKTGTYFQAQKELVQQFKDRAH